jgi:hypothetical protein
MPSSLKDFYLNEVMRNDVKTYLIDFLKVQAIEKAFAKEDVSGIADANEVINKAFENLEVLFSPKVKEKEQVNEAR